MATAVPAGFVHTLNFLSHLINVSGDIQQLLVWLQLEAACVPHISPFCQLKPGSTRAP